MTTLGPMRGEKNKPAHKVMYGRLVNSLEHEHAPTPQGEGRQPPSLPLPFPLVSPPFPLAGEGGPTIS